MKKIIRLRNSILFFLVLFSVPIFGQTPTIYGEALVKEGDVYTYEFSFNAHSYSWEVFGGTIITPNPNSNRRIQVIWNRVNALIICKAQSAS